MINKIFENAIIGIEETSETKLTEEQKIAICFTITHLINDAIKMMQMEITASKTKVENMYSFKLMP